MGGLYIVGGSVAMKNRRVVPQKIKTRSSISHNNSTSEYVSKGVEIRDMNRYLYAHVHVNIIQIDKRWKQPKYSFIDEWTKYSIHI